jgi:hypothetical protein
MAISYGHAPRTDFGKPPLPYSSVARVAFKKIQDLVDAIQ